MTREEAASRIRQALSVPNRLQGFVLIDEESANMAIEALSAIDAPEDRPTGHWSDVGVGEACSNCHKIQYGYGSFRHYCPNCGAQMDSAKPAGDSIK